MLGVVAAEVEIEKDRHAVGCVGWRGLGNIFGEIQQHFGGRCVGRIAEFERGLEPHGRDVAGQRDIGPLDCAHHRHRHCRQSPAVDKLFEQFELVRPRRRLPSLG